ncbi:DUF1294 domain-containing protein [Lysobacter sp. HDW10]|uniref:DUF1294 domain-containing protein n=1 Tax=Lysobacter sp. HDW10 TaxID=2714936 RepID=UPI00140B2F78|nr:cold shock and DUF1294 domain-containing protein [Lysobacter sp. HDW10]QIK80882.1 DUF1294 domain-containing protein [Lysobacter sp. HDW10]
MSRTSSAPSTYRHAGKITDWDDERGFGFVTPNGGGDRVFVHIKAFEFRNKRPHDGLLISYHVQRDAKGRLNAVNVKQAVKLRDPYRVEFPRKIIAVTFLALIVLGAVVSKLPLLIAGVYVLMSAVTFYSYGEDKRATKQRAYRTPESTLHLMSLFGGWPGALIAQAMLRHKNKKTEFQATFWICVIVNLALLVWVVSSGILDSLSDIPLVMSS